MMKKNHASKDAVKWRKCFKGKKKKRKKINTMRKRRIKIGRRTTKKFIDA